MKHAATTSKIALGALFCLFLSTACDNGPDGNASPAPQGQVVFDQPLAAIVEMNSLIEERDEARIEAVFGPGSLELFHSGDDQADREDILRIGKMIETGVVFDEYGEDTLVALLGESQWPWPIPLVREDDGWRFDTDRGRDELLNRRIGRNELWTLTALHEIVEAQREYRREGHGDNPQAFAQRFLSSPGRRDGLFWPTEDGEPPSPLGEFLAESDIRSTEEPQPFHGYYYRMLFERGPSAPGGARSYLDREGLLTGGFAVIAAPAKYGNSGVMTFITDQRGLVYQKDLGEETGQLAARIDRFDPDETWTPTPDMLEDSHFLD